MHAYFVLNIREYYGVQCIAYNWKSEERSGSLVNVVKLRMVVEDMEMKNYAQSSTNIIQINPDRKANIYIHTFVN